MRQISDEGRREIAKELREQFYCCQYAEEFTEGLYDVLDLGHCEPTHGGYPDLAERLADYVEPAPVTGSTSDGYHTFDELYHHRAVLFSVIVAMFRGRSWKSLHHHDGSMYDGMFIVGIDKVEDVRERSLDRPNVMSVTCPSCGMSNRIAWGSLMATPQKEAVSMLVDSWNSR